MAEGGIIRRATFHVQRGLVISPVPVTLEAHGVRLEPLAASHASELAAASRDGRLWELWYTAVPHGFETLGCKLIGLRTDNFNFRSQRAIEALGAKRDGVLRHHMARRDGSVRDSFMYSILSSKWPDVKRNLESRLLRARGAEP